LSACEENDQIGNFLKRFKARMTADELVFANRKRNLDGIALLGLTLDEGERIILDLTDMNYSSGPDEDHNGTRGETWTFSTGVASRNIRIKLKLDERKAICILFHPLEFENSFVGGEH